MVGATESVRVRVGQRQRAANTPTNGRVQQVKRGRRLELLQEQKPQAWSALLSTLLSGVVFAANPRTKAILARFQTT